MILFDTNVIIYASQPNSVFFDWARETIANGVSEGGAAINSVALAEICVGDPDPPTVSRRLRNWGLLILDLPYAASQICADAYRTYLERRNLESGGPIPKVPLPDFFIGAHSQLMGWPLATADVGRFQTYFPQVDLITPSS